MKGKEEQNERENQVITSIRKVSFVKQKKTASNVPGKTEIQLKEKSLFLLLIVPIIIIIAILLSVHYKTHTTTNYYYTVLLFTLKEFLSTKLPAPGTHL